MSAEHTDPEVIVHISIRLPNTHREALAGLLEPLLAHAVGVGGNDTHISVRPYDPDEDFDD